MLRAPSGFYPSPDDITKGHYTYQQYWNNKNPEDFSSQAQSLCHRQSLPVIQPRTLSTVYATTRCHNILACYMICLYIIQYDLCVHLCMIWDVLALSACMGLTCSTAALCCLINCLSICRTNLAVCSYQVFEVPSSWHSVLVRLVMIDKKMRNCFKMIELHLRRHAVRFVYGLWWGAWSL